MRAAIVPWARALVRRYRGRVQKGWPAAVSGGPQKDPVGRHRNRSVVSRTERSAALNRCARQETAARQADEAVAALYDSHYRALTQLAALLVGDLWAAEDIAQAAFVAMHRTWRLLQTSDAALLYLRREVVRRARRRQPRHGNAGEAPEPQLHGNPVAARALALVATLSVRQREAVILRYWAGLPDAEIAELTGARPQAVVANLNQGLAVLAAALEWEHDAADRHTLLGPAGIDP